MAEENTVTMTVENVDRLFGEIVVNGESHVSENYVPPVQMEHTSPQSTVQEEEPQSSTPAQAVQGQDVYAVELNEVLHDFSDRDLTQSLADEVSARQQADGALQNSVSAIQNKIPSEATSTNKLADKAFVGTSIANAVNALDASSVGGNNKYIKSISEADGVISATEGSIDTEVTDGSSNPVTSDAVYDAIQESKGDSIKTYPTMTDLEQDLPNLAEGQIVATEEGDAFTTVDTVQSGVFNPVTSNAVANYIKHHIQSFSVASSDWRQSSAGMYYCEKGNLSTYFGTNDYTLLGFYIGYWGSCSARNFQLYVEGDTFGFMTDNSGLSLGVINVHFSYV